MKVIEADTNKRKYILCSWIERINIVKNDHTTQDNLQIQRNLYQITGGIFHKTRTKKFFLICMETENTPVKTILREKNESGGITVPDFRLYCKVIVMVNYVAVTETRHID